jgi:hypothetical protein
VNRSYDFLNRHHDGSIYPVLLERNKQVNVENKARNQGVVYENGKGGRSAYKQGSA